MSEYNVCRRQILTSKVDPRTVSSVWIANENGQCQWLADPENLYMPDNSEKNNWVKNKCRQVAAILIIGGKLKI